MAQSIVVVGFNLADLFERVADAVPDRVAVIEGDTQRTYAELDDRATRLAHSLSLAAGTHIGLCLSNSIVHLELILACFKCRCVPVNVNWRYTESERHYLTEDGDLAQLWRDADVDANRIEPLITTGSPVRDFPERSGDDLYVLYTGGTTGRPKGVVWRHEDIFFAAFGGGNPGGPPISAPDEIVASVLDNPAQRLRAFLADSDPGPAQLVALALGPLVHASGQWTALGTLLGGGAIVLYRDPHVDAKRVLDLITRHGVHSLNLVGDASARPLIDCLRTGSDRFDTSSLQLLGSGGAMLSADSKDELLRLLPNLRAIVEGIGSSESPAQAVSVTTRDRVTPASLTFAAKPETMVVDDDLRPIPAGSGRAGRLATRGRVPLGYYNDGERSARTFVEIDGERWSLPGDMATIDADGTVHLLGRGSQCINTGGEKVYPEEVEAVCKSAPGIVDAVVIGVADPVMGQRVVALVTASGGDGGEVGGGDAPTLDALQQHCRERLAGYKIPRAVHVVERIERTEAGKADYLWAREVVEQAAGPISRTTSSPQG